jgi:polyhydroxyalkanoate synthase subunit PhaC
MLRREGPTGATDGCESGTPIGNFFALPLALQKALLGLNNGRELQEAAWATYDTLIRLANEFTDRAYGDPLFGAAAARWMEMALKWQRFGSTLASAFFAALWPAVGLPTSAELAELRTEIRKLQASASLRRKAEEQPKFESLALVDVADIVPPASGGRNAEAPLFALKARRDPALGSIAEYWLEGALRTLQGLKTGFDSTVDDPPPVTPHRVIYEGGKLRLRHYPSAGRTHRIPVLMVYALMKRPFVFDLQKGRSVIEFLTRAGFDVFLTDWLPPTAADTWRGFDAYVNGDLEAAVRTVRSHSHTEEITIMGYCFGALLSLAYAALHPAGINNLITATVPFDMSVRELPIYKVVDHMSDEAVDLVTRTYGNCPAWLVQTFFTAMAPAHHAIDKYVGLYRNAKREGYAEAFELFERWMNSDVALAGRIFKETVTGIFGRNQFARGEFQVGGRTVDLSQIRCPLLNLVAEFDDVVHPRSSLPLVDRVGSQDRRSLTVATGHVGAMVSSTAHKRLWPQVAQWLAERSD